LQNRDGTFTGSSPSQALLRRGPARVRLEDSPVHRRSLLSSIVPSAAVVAASLVLPLAPARAATEVTFWHSFASGEGAKAIAAMVERFHAAQPEVRVKAEFAGSYGDLVTKLQAAIPARRQPHLVMLEITRYGLFAERGALAPLEPFLEREGTSFTEQIRPFAREAASYKGRSFVLPFNVSTPLLYYNRDLFAAAGLDPDKAPATWDELLAAARKLQRTENGRPAVWGINPPPQWVRWAMTHQAGGGWVLPDTDEVLIDRPESVEAYRTAASWVIEHGLASKDAALDEKVAVQYFLSGQAAIHFDSTGSLGNLKRDAKFSVGVAPLPCKLRCAAPVGGAVIGLLAGHPPAETEAAWRFLAFINRPEQNATVFALTGYLPVLAATPTMPEAKARLEGDPAWSAAIKQLDVAFVRARPPAMPAIRAKEEQVWQAIVLGKQSAEQALAEFAQEMRRLLAGS
jgi:sn-glycerol 3-phosphate transport system substrate-binding protein